MKPTTVFFLFPVYLFAETISVSPQSAIQETLDALSDGDVVEFSEGIYTGSYTLNNKSFSQGVTLKAKTGGKVIFDGTETLSDHWENVAGEVWKQKLQNPIWQLFKDYVQQTPARWPNARYESEGGYLELSDDYWAHCENKDYSKTHLFDQDFPFASGEVDGAMIVVNNSSWKTFASRVTSTAGSIVNFEATPSTVANKECPYFLENHPSLLDTLREWYYDVSDSTLYVYGDPRGSEWKGRVRSNAFSFENSANITLEGFHFFASRISSLESTNLTVLKNRFSYAAVSKRVLGDISALPVLSFEMNNNAREIGLRFEKNLVEWTDGEMIYVKGKGAKIYDNYGHHIDYTATSKRGLHVSVYVNGSNAEFYRNEIFLTGSSSLLLPGDSSLIHFNDFYNTGHVQSDGAVIQYTRTQVEGNNAHHNYIHDTDKYGIRFDAPSSQPELAGKGGLIHHNLFARLNKGLMAKGDEHMIFNNTFYQNSGNDYIALAEAEGNLNSYSFNNLGAKLSGHRSNSYQESPVPGVYTNNWNGYEEEDSIEDHFRDPEGGDFRLKSTSSLVGGGTNVNELPSNDMPDVGAFQGDSNWLKEVGISWNADSVVPIPELFATENVVSVAQLEKPEHHSFNLQNRKDKLFWESGRMVEKIEVFNLRGEKILEEGIDAKRGTLQLERLSSRILIFRFISEGGDFVQKKVHLKL